MRRIIISFDSNYVEIEGYGKWAVKQPHIHLQILEEIFNSLNPDGVKLVEVDEGQEHTIGEW